MGVPIISSISEMNSFTTYAQSQSYTYGSVAEALETGRYLEPVPNTNVFNATDARFQVLEYQPELTGGTKAGTGIVDFIKGEGRCEPFVYGAAISLSVPEVIGGIISGLGLSIAAYEFNKDFWVDVSNNAFQNFPGYTPVNYNTIDDMSIIGLFKNNVTYVPADVIQAMANYLLSIGAYDQGKSKVVYELPQQEGRYQLLSAEVTKDNIITLANRIRSELGDNDYYTGEALYELSEGLDFYGIPSNAKYFSVDYNKFGVSFGVRFYGGDVPIDCYYNGSQITNWYGEHTFMNGVGGKAIYGYPQGSGMSFEAITTDQSVYLGVSNQGVTAYTSSISATIEITPTIPQLVPLPNAIPVEAPNNIPLEFPLWWASKAVIRNPETETPYLPVGIPDTDPRTQPVTRPQPDTQTGTIPDDRKKPVEDGPSKMPEPKGPIKRDKYPKEPTPTPTPTPPIPVIPEIGGQANKLFTVYNPSQANLNSLGAVLWSSNVIQQIVQMFTNNPLDAIISLHILYATPTTGANKEIKLGYVPTGVSCPEVTNQYVNVNCGTVRVPELFGDVRDYSNTDITIYLPMIGFRQLKTEDAMASNITVDYKVDVFTGTVLANVTVTRDGVNKVFYTFEGNCAVNLPLTGADKSRQLATAVGVIGSVVTANPVMGMASATAIAGGSARANIQRSGNFTGNAGAMGCKKPYIIVSSDIPYDAVGYNTQYGYPANLTVMLGTCSGYVKVKEVHADTVANATEQEKRDIENQLKQGIIIH